MQHLLYLDPNDIPGVSVLSKQLSLFAPYGTFSFSPHFWSLQNVYSGSQSYKINFVIKITELVHNSMTMDYFKLNHK